MKQSTKASIDVLTPLASEVREAVITRSPFTKAELEYQERSRQWLLDRVVNADRANQIATEEGLDAARKFCDAFNATKPKRRVGRPRTVAPSPELLNRVLLDVILVEVVPTLSRQQRARIVESATSEIVNRLA